MREPGAGLSAGSAVIIRQVSAGSVGLLIREIGAGILAASPEVGARLRIELRSLQERMESIVDEWPQSCVCHVIEDTPVRKRS